MSLNPDYLYRGKVTRVVDGDTVDIEVDLGFYLKANIRFRLVGINAPEMNSADPAVRIAAVASTEYLTNLLGAQNPTPMSVVLRSTKTEKYGRWLADLWIPAEEPSSPLSVNSAMLVAGHATAYFGGAR